MRVADTVTVTPALSVAGALRVPGDKSISHRYALLAAHRRRPIHHCQLRARRRLRLDAGVRRSPRRYRLTNPARRRAANRRSSPSTAAACAACARPPRRSIAAIPAAPCACWAASSPRIPLYRPLSATLHSRAGRCAGSSGRCRKWAPPSPPAPGDRPPVTIHGARPRRHPFQAGNAQRPGEVAPCCWQGCRRAAKPRFWSPPLLVIIRNGRSPRSARRVTIEGRPHHDQGGQRLTAPR